MEPMDKIDVKVYAAYKQPIYRSGTEQISWCKNVFTLSQGHSRPIISVFNVFRMKNWSTMKVVFCMYIDTPAYSYE